VAEEGAGLLGQHLDIALSALMSLKPAEAKAAVNRLMANGSAERRREVGYSYALSRAKTTVDALAVATIRALLDSDDASVVHSGVAATRSLSQHPRVMLDFMCCADLGISAKVADEALALIVFDHRGTIGHVTEGDVRSLLARLDQLLELDGHWIEEFLAYASEKHPRVLAGFFITRVDRATAANDWSLRPCNYGPYGHVPLRFRKSDDFAAVLARVVSWMYAHDSENALFGMRSAQLFGSMFTPFDDGLLEVIASLSGEANAEELRTISRVLREAPNWVVTQKRDFVVRFLSRCRQFGDECYSDARSDLFTAARMSLRARTETGPPRRKLVRLHRLQRSRRSCGDHAHPAHCSEFIFDVLFPGCAQGRRGYRSRETSS
jgi:hypothetical protein